MATPEQATYRTAMYTVDARAARAVAPPHVDIVETEPGRCQVVRAVIDDRDNDMGDYLEVGITFFVNPTGAADQAGTYISRLPVDQESTFAAGRAIWGFPKSVEASPSTTPRHPSPAPCAWTTGSPSA